MPQLLPLQPEPDRLQVTLVLLVPVTFALNCRLVPVTTCTDAGDTLTPIAGTIVTSALADLSGCETEVAVTVTAAGLGTLPGAV